MLDDEDLDGQYVAFQAMANDATPDEAVRMMKLLRVPGDVIEAIRKRHEDEVIKIREAREPDSVYVSGRLTWYTGPQPKDRFWPALVHKLESGPRPWSEEAVESLNRASTKVVGLLDHPKVGNFRTMGLVLGYVQSGKTANFTAVMAKAADRGYRLLIVLSGIHNGLRRQTQSRLARELVSVNPGNWHEVTTVDYDFRPPGNAAAYFNARDQHILLVVKKNAHVLKKLNSWLASAKDYLKECPTLVIDDEADQATVGGKKINPLMAGLLRSFPKVCYVGYTATPFANLLIDPGKDEDFYPRDFIVSLPMPEGYQGPEVLFGRDPLDGEDPSVVPGGYDMIRVIPVDEVESVRPMSKAAAAGFVPDMTPSLRHAVLYFWLATAARRVRGTGVPHSTMLIHTTLDTYIHEQFRPLLSALQRKVGGQLADPNSAIHDELRQHWLEETSRVPAVDFHEPPVSFDALAQHLPGVVHDNRVVVDNYRSQDRLDYESGPVVAIAVGGNTLSRGLTLEGLVSSYFVRASSAYDTLLQMGRWFGHRGGYADLPRIWMTEELADWFRHLAVVEAEIRKDIDRYITEDKDPMTFAVRIRTHPKLLATAPARMKDAVKASAAYGGDLVESRYFKTGDDEGEWLRTNEDAAVRLISDAMQHGREADLDQPARKLWRDVSYRDVVNFLRTYRFHEKQEEARAELLIKYIDKRAQHGALTQWDVAVVGSSRKDAPSWKLPDGTTVGMVNRSRLNRLGQPADIKTLTGSRDPLINLPVPDDAQAMKRSDIDQLRQRTRPDVGLLLLYPIDPTSPATAANRHDLDAPDGVNAVLGAALVFPKPRKDDVVEHQYISARLPDLLFDGYVEEEDLAAFEHDEDAG